MKTTIHSAAIRILSAERARMKAMAAKYRTLARGAAAGEKKLYRTAATRCTNTAANLLASIRSLKGGRI